MTNKAIESEIIDVLEKSKGEKISVRELAKRMDRMPGYTWILEKAKQLAKDEKINMSEEMYDTGHNNIKMIARVVWAK